MPKIECIKNVVMANGKRIGQIAFIEGKTYNARMRLQQDGYDYQKVLSAKNEFGITHGIKNETDDEFFKAHFKESKSK